jgi:hypothetical protein
MGVDGQSHTPVALTPRKTRYPLSMNKGRLKHGFRLTACWLLKKMFRGCTVSSHAGMERDRLLGPLPLTRSVYHDFLGNFLTYWKMWIFRLQFIYGSWMIVLHQIFFLQFGNSWTTTWPASSTDLSSLYSYFWEHLKVTLYAAAVSDIQNLQQWLQNGLWMIWLTPKVFQQFRQSLFRRTRSCVEVQRGHCEHFV